MRRLAGGRIDRGVEAEGEGRQEALPIGDLGVGVEDGGAKVFGRVPVGTFNLQVTTWVKWASKSMVYAQRRPEAALQVVVKLAAVVRDYNLRDAENGDPVPPDGFGNLRRGFLGHRR
jgi:DNA helicase IV